MPYSVLDKMTRVVLQELESPRSPDQKPLRNKDWPANPFKPTPLLEDPYESSLEEHPPLGSDLHRVQSFSPESVNDTPNDAFDLEYETQIETETDLPELPPLVSDLHRVKSISPETVSDSPNDAFDLEYETQIETETDLPELPPLVSDLHRVKSISPETVSDSPNDAFELEYETQIETEADLPEKYLVEPPPNTLRTHSTFPREINFDNTRLENHIEQHVKKPASKYGETPINIPPNSLKSQFTISWNLNKLAKTRVDKLNRNIKLETKHDRQTESESLEYDEEKLESVDHWSNTPRIFKLETKPEHKKIKRPKKIEKQLIRPRADDISVTKIETYSACMKFAAFDRTLRHQDDKSRNQPDFEPQAISEDIPDVSACREKKLIYLTARDPRYEIIGGLWVESVHDELLHFGLALKKGKGELYSYATVEERLVLALFAMIKDKTLKNFNWLSCPNAYGWKGNFGDPILVKNGFVCNRQTCSKYLCDSPERETPERETQIGRPVDPETPTTGDTSCSCHIL
eukprot:177103_1